MKLIERNYLAFLSIWLFASFFWYVYAADTTYDTFSSQTSTGLGSNSSVISTEYYPRPSWSWAYYINRWNNSSVIGNYFEWFYFDSMLWYFEFDWSTDDDLNVRIVWSTNVCPGSYGYKLGGYSYSPAFWLMDFDYNESTFVYYCESDWFLRWYARAEFWWFQNFEGITFDILSFSDVPIETPPWDDDTFVNPETNIDGSPPGWNSSTQTNSNFTPNSIQNDRFEFDVKLESLFYIIK